MRQGPQPPACVVESCDRLPANGLIGYCTGHEKLLGDGSTATPPIAEPDDPALLERLARQTATAEEQEYAERRRVKTWKTLENGSRVPEEYWTDEELAKIEEEAQAVIRMGEPGIMRSHFPNGLPQEPPPDPVKIATRAFKRALRGKHGPAAEKMAWAFAASLDDH